MNTSTISSPSISPQPLKPNAFPYDVAKVYDILENINDAFFILDRKYQFTYLNRQAEKLLMRNRDELIGKDVWEEFPDARNSIFFERYSHALTTGEAVQFESYYPPLETWFNVSAYPSEDSLSVYFTDITPRMKIQHELEQSEKQYRSLFETMPQGVIYYNKEGKVERINSASERILGRTLKEMQENKKKTRYPTINEQGVIFNEENDPVLTAIKTRTSIHKLMMGVFNPREKEYKWILFSAIPKLDEETGEVQQLYATFEDISERKNVEEKLLRTQIALKQTEEDFRNLAETIPQLVWVTRPDGYHIYYNQRWYDYTGLKYEETKGVGWNKVLHPEDQDRARQVWQHSLETGEPYQIEYRLKNGKKDEFRWFLARALPIRDERGTITKWFGTCTDIDEQKRVLENQIFLAEAGKLLSSSLDYKVTLQKVSEIAVPHIADWCAVDIIDGTNVQLVAVAHKNPEEIEWAREIREKFPPQLDPSSGLGKVITTGEIEYLPYIDQALIKAAAKTKEELALLEKIGFHSLIIAPLTVDNRNIGAITLVSTESKHMFNSDDVNMAKELSTRASLAIQNAMLYEKAQLREKQFKALYDTNVIGVIYCDLNGKIYDANNAFLTTVGYTRQDLKSGRLKWDKMTPPEFKESDEMAVAEIMTNGYAAPWEKEYIRKDGSQVPVLVGCALLNKETTETIAFIIDITERKKLEQRKDEFIGIASHELKTPLTSIKGYTQILERIIQQMGDERLNLYLKKTNTYIDRLNSLIADLLDVSKIQAGKLKMDFSEFPFDDLVKDGVESIQHTDSHHKIRIEGKTNVTICGDRHRLEQVFTNLLSNAIKYSPDADSVSVSVEDKGSHVQVSVTDFGIGIPQDRMHKVFERFYRVEEASKNFSGLGIGLYISYEIITRHHGKIWVESEEGKGSTFYFTLPKLNTLGEELN